MPNQPPLNPDALGRMFATAMMEVLDAEKLQPGNRLAHVNDIQEVLNRLEKNILTVAQPVLNSVEGIPAQVQVISWEEEPEHECWKLAPDETFVGLIVKSDRAWSPADKYTLNIQRPAVDDA